MREKDAERDGRTDTQRERDEISKRREKGTRKANYVYEWMAAIKNNANSVKENSLFVGGGAKAGKNRNWHRIRSLLAVPIGRLSARPLHSACCLSVEFAQSADDLSLPVRLATVP